MLCLRACPSSAPSPVDWPPEVIAQTVLLVVPAMESSAQIHIIGVMTEAAEYAGGGVLLGIDKTEYFGINEDLNQISMYQPRFDSSTRMSMAPFEFIADL